LIQGRGGTRPSQDGLDFGAGALRRFAQQKGEKVASLFLFQSVDQPGRHQRNGAGAEFLYFLATKNYFLSIRAEQPEGLGVLGSNDKLDFSALGDTVNVAARLGSVAGAGELVVSRAAWDRAGLALDGTESRAIDIAGREAKLDVVVSRYPRVTASAA